MSDLDLRVWAALGAIRGLGPARLVRIASRLEELAMGAAELAGAGEDRLRTAGIEDRFVSEARRVLEAPTEVEEAAAGGRILSPDDEHYPRHRLTRALPLPVVLYANGNTSLLQQPSVAIAGARSAPPVAIQYADRVARVLAGAGQVIVSGLAAGVDSAAHVGAVGGGGSTIAVLAEGLDAAATKASTLLAMDEDRVLVVSGYAPHEPWTPHRAMARNTTIAGLSDVVIVVASDLRGGSFAQGELCLAKGKRLLVPDFPQEVGPGNRELIRRGAEPLDAESPAAVLAHMRDIGSVGAVGPVELVESQTTFDLSVQGPEETSITQGVPK